MELRRAVPPSAKNLIIYGDPMQVVHPQVALGHTKKMVGTPDSWPPSWRIA
jgi:hypothetical protein